jgi:hypothetical protein
VEGAEAVEEDSDIVRGHSCNFVQQTPPDPEGGIVVNGIIVMRSNSRGSPNLLLSLIL